jgi:cytochrome P450
LLWVPKLRSNDNNANVLMQYCLYELALNPEIMDRVRAEHDHFLDPNLDTTTQLMRDRPQRINDLAFTTAVIKEVLRMYSPASTIRTAENM